jgi:O-antigen/teichoic acid export membrane protein
MTTDDSTAEKIFARTEHGQRTILLSQFVRVLCKVVSLLVLARLVAPAEHGLFAMAASVTLLLSLLRDLGLGVAAVQAPRLSEDERTTLGWIHVALGVSLMLATLGLIPLAAWFYDEPRLGPLLALMSVHFLLMGVSAWPRVLLAREIEFPAINRIETLATVLATAAMIAAGVAGWGAYAFAIFLVSVEAFIAVEVWRRCPWRPRGRLHWRLARPFLRTGLDITSYQTVLHLSQHLDSFLVGRWFGAYSLGLYFRSGQLLQITALHITSPLAQVLLASLSRLGVSAPAFRERFCANVSVVLHLALPVTVYCIVLPRDVAWIALGREWLDAVPFFRWMAFSAAFAAMTSLGYSLNVASGQTRRLTGLAALALGANVLALTLARPFGAAAVALGLAIANGLLLLPRLWWICRATPITLADYLSALAGPVAVAGTLAGGLALGAWFVPSELPALRLAGATFAGIAAVALLSGVWRRPRMELNAVWHLRPWRRPAL